MDAVERPVYYPRAGARRRSKAKDEIVRWVVDDFEASARFKQPLLSLFDIYWRIYLSEPRPQTQDDPGRWGSNPVGPHGGMAVRVLVPLIKRPILSTRPFIRAIPNKKELADLEPLLSQRMSYWIDQARLRKIILTDCLIEGLVFGAGFWKAYHSLRMRPVLRTVPVLDANGDPTYDPQGQVKTKDELDEEPWKEGPKVVSVPIERAYWDPTASDLEDADYFIDRFFKTKNELLDDPSYNADKVNECCQTNTGGGSATPLREMFELERRRRIAGFTQGEWERKTERLKQRGDDMVECLELISGGSCFVIGNRGQIIKETVLDHPLPVGAIVPMPIPGEIIGKSIFHDAVHIMDERDFVAGMIYDNMAQVVHRMSKGIPGLFDEESIDARPGGVVLVSNMNAFEPLPVQDIVGSAFGVLTHLDRDIERATMVSEPLSAIGAGAGTVYPETAHGIDVKAGNAEAPVAEMVSHVEQEGLYRLARILWDIEREYTTREDWLDLCGEEGDRWVDVDFDTMARDVDFEVVGSAYAQAKQNEVQAIGMFMQQCMAVLPVDPKAVDLRELIRTAGQILDIPNLDRIVPGNPQDRGPEVEHEVMRRGLPVHPTDDEDLQQHYQAHLQEFLRAAQANEDPIYMRRLTDHIKETERKVRQMQAAAGLAMQEAAAGGGDAGSGAGVPVGADQSTGPGPGQAAGAGPAGGGPPVIPGVA